MNTGELGGARRDEKHIACAQQLFRPRLINNRARIDFGGDFKRDTRGEVGFDESGDDVNGRPLRGQNQVNAGCACHLGEPRQRFFHIPRCHHHQISELIDHDHDIGKLDVLKWRRVFNGFFRRVTARSGFRFELSKHCRHLALGSGDQHFIVGIDALHAERANDFIAAFHLLDGPAQHLRSFFRVNHHRVHQVRNAFVGG